MSVRPIVYSTVPKLYLLVCRTMGRRSVACAPSSGSNFCNLFHFTYKGRTSSSNRPGRSTPTAPETIKAVGTEPWEGRSVFALCLYSNFYSTYSISHL
ncbi:hypothetical protein AVEN_227873-1 [Araneus ventricosus]|uniref:Uncharacterized protein n=1 Tax=Araneus ventricosus TaxID=182803 RepID=A0A4Y1ZP02_ARAVE|nr:hypothetical protein AVEN_227873-1 [Araneus ventricosus]